VRPWPVVEFLHTYWARRGAAHSSQRREAVGAIARGPLIGKADVKTEITIWQRRANRDILSDCREYVVRCQEASDPLQLELSHWLDLYRMLDFVSTRGLIKICPGLASSHSREATLDTVPPPLPPRIRK
jgi:hypothetical protein